MNVLIPKCSDFEINYLTHSIKKNSTTFFLKQCHSSASALSGITAEYSHATIPNKSNGKEWQKKSRSI